MTYDMQYFALAKPIKLSKINVNLRLSMYGEGRSNTLTKTYCILRIYRKLYQSRDLKAFAKSKNGLFLS